MLATVSKACPPRACSSRKADELPAYRIHATSGDKIQIPLPEHEAIRGLFKVQPIKDMPRPGANPTGKKKPTKTKTKK
jgi:hypothetical protein